MFCAGVLAMSACLAEAAEMAEPGENLVRNGNFLAWDTYSGKGVTTTSVGVPPNSLPKDWYGGPGVGATATYDVVPFSPGQTDVPGNPERFFRVSWSVSPTKDWPGEAHHQPAFRFTFLEYFGMGDVHLLEGKTAICSFYARTNEGSVDIVPLLWHSYDANTPGIAGVKGKGYELFESSGKPGVVTVAQGAPNPEAVCRLTSRWQRFEKRIALPGTQNKSVTPGNYTGVGFDLVAREVNTIDLAEIRVVPLQGQD
ncbi:MAG: hypothetical protein IT365_04930 [Candidatus Hydrogenedentes bacterium]|nr:hypothetical protein [Candidatus Hydrogenedentota bacterium]